MSNKLMLSVALFGLAANFAIAQQTEVAPAQVAATESAIPSESAALPAGTVPKLNIVWECGSCQPNEKVPPLIEQAFQAEALKHGKTVSTTVSVDAKVYQFRQRNPGVRVMFGVMAGKDRLTLKITYKGKELVAGDYSANAIEGMNYLCESVGKEAYEKIASLL